MLSACISYFTQEQGKGSLHLHFILFTGKLSPTSIQKALGDPVAIAAISERLDAMVQAHVPRDDVKDIADSLRDNVRAQTLLKGGSPWGPSDAIHAGVRAIAAQRNTAGDPLPCTETGTPCGCRTTPESIAPSQWDAGIEYASSLDHQEAWDPAAEAADLDIEYDEQAAESAAGYRDVSGSKSTPAPALAPVSVCDGNPDVCKCSCTCHSSRPTHAQYYVPCPPTDKESLQAYNYYIACLVLSVNFHRHTATCRKGKMGKCQCRVGYPAASNDLGTLPREVDYRRLGPRGRPLAFASLSPIISEPPSPADANYPFPRKDYRYDGYDYSMRYTKMHEAKTTNTSFVLL